MINTLLIPFFIIFIMLMIGRIVANTIKKIKKREKDFLQELQTTHNERLALILEMKNALNARDEFLSIASHELKTPLTSLILHSQHFKRSIERGDADVYSKERIDKMIGKMEKQVLKLNRLVNDMLDISRIRTGKMSFQFQEFNFTDLIEELNENLKDQFISSNTPLPIIENNCGNIIIKWDKIRIEQVLTHLFINAIAYGKGKQIILTSNVLDEKIVIHLKDHGIGIAEENLDKIFYCFEKTRPASEVRGLGLGLFISKQIIDAHQGAISVESQAGVGTVFKIELPL